ncbi:MAG: dihydropyrimidinase [Candidatus Sumerlaeaceae bacterium]|nr:dihydropyrimidinase [Candidatus Sumerlaeaceae bacterium]
MKRESVLYDLVVAGGDVVLPDRMLRADVAVSKGRIEAVGPGLAAKARKIVDAAGHLVLPGAVDVHVHLDLPIGGGVTTSDDWRSGTRAAARGGVTTVVDFATPYARNDGSGEYESLSEAVDHWFRRAEGKAIVDYTWHVCITRYDQHRREIRSMIRRGFPTFKEFMIYGSRGLMSDDRAVYCTLEDLRGTGGLLLLHAESPMILDEMVSRYHKPSLMKRFGARLHAMTRPPVVEIDAVQRAALWCEVTGGPLYIVHVSCGRSAEIIGEARRRGAPLLAETCAHYLVLDESVFERPDGHLFAHSPQVKTPADRQRLWRALKEGELLAVSTDTCTFTRKQKGAWGGDWTRLPNGLPGLETLVPIVYTHGVLKGRLTITEMCRLVATQPARMMGLYPRKGAIVRGADADLAIIHPRKRMRVDPDQMETNADWSPYQGWNLAGFARTTISRGEVIVDDYKVLASDGRGQWLRRESAGGEP